MHYTIIVGFSSVVKAVELLLKAKVIGGIKKSIGTKLILCFRKCSVLKMNKRST